MAAFTTIATTALAVGGSAMNFAQAAKQGKLQREAELDAEKAMKAARDKLQTNFYKGLDLNLKSFEQERDALAGVGQQLIQAGQESERGAAATAGRVMAGIQEAEKDITNRQIRSQENLEKLVADEEAKLAMAETRLDLAEVEGAQEAAAEAAKNQAAAITSGIQGLGSAAAGLSESAELYPQDNSGDGGFGGMSYGQYQGQGGQMSKDDFKNILGGGTGVGNLLSGVGGKISGLFKSIFGGGN